MDDLLADFLTETNENLAELDLALVTLERTPDDADTLALIFRMVHTIKGTCGFLGLPRLERVAHAAESVLGKVRDRAIPVTPDLVSLVLTALDRVKAILAGLGGAGTEPPGDDSALVAALEAAATGAPAVAPAAVPRAAEDRAEAGARPSEPPQAPIGSVAEQAAQEAPPAEEETPAAVADPAPLQTAPPGKPVDAVTVANAPTGPQTIRVAVEVLEDLMTLVSELVLTRNQLLQLARSEQDSGFTAPLQRLSHITSDLQEGVMKTRMQPIGNAWNNLPRLVRDLAHDMDKKIELVMLGADTELDRQVLELIKDPLTHMVRNSGDHGLEKPAERRAAGKPETGRITLNAFHEGGHIIIEVSDDGRGLPVDKIRKKILAQGLATEAELAGMSDGQLQRFIFRAGFSTAAVVTAVSGRGVGMDVVKTNIEKIGGTIDLKSVAGQGTTFTIKIPLTLAIVSALIVQAAGERFAIPQISVVELVRAHRAGSNTAAGTDSVIERINDTPVLRLRDHLLPLVSLTELLALDAEEAATGDATIVVVQVGASMLGIIVDRVFDTEEIVVKPVAPILRHVTMFSGNTILGDGSVIMILDPNGIARATGIGAGGEARNAATETKETFYSTERTAMLLFRAGSAQKMAVPLGLVARLEDIPRDKIEYSSGSPVTQYRGKLMPLIALAGAMADGKTHQPVLVFADRDRSMGLMVDEIIDVVEDRLDIQLSGARPGLLGTAVIAGDATDVIDTGYWLTQAWQDWFRGVPKAASGQVNRRVLVVEDSDFFRQLLVPILGAAGYRVTAAPGAAEALKLREAGVMFDAIVSDIEMPHMDGLAFARAVRESGAWTSLPMIALTGHVEPRDVEAGRDAGFTDYVAKFEREALLASLQQCLSEPVAAG